MQFKAVPVSGDYEALQRQVTRIVIAEIRASVRSFKVVSKSKNTYYENSKQRLRSTPNCGSRFCAHPVEQTREGFKIWYSGPPNPRPNGK